MAFWMETLIGMASDMMTKHIPYSFGEDLTQKFIRKAGEVTKLCLSKL